MDHGVAQAADRGIFATWYDLPAGGEDDHLRWMAESYLPLVQAQPGIRWAALYRRTEKEPRAKARQSGLIYTTDPKVGTGRDFISVFGADDADVFGTMLPLLREGASAEDKALLGQRQNMRENISTEVSRVAGPELAGYADGETLAPCIQFGNYNCQLETEDVLLTHYARARLPALSDLPGIVRTRTLSAVCGWARHLVIYEFISFEAREHFTTPRAEGPPEFRPLTEIFIPTLTHAPDSPSIAKRVWPVVG